MSTIGVLSHILRLDISSLKSLKPMSSGFFSSSPIFTCVFYSSSSFPAILILALAISHKFLYPTPYASYSSLYFLGNWTQIYLRLPPSLEFNCIMSYYCCCPNIIFFYDLHIFIVFFKESVYLKFYFFKVNIGTFSYLCSISNTFKLNFLIFSF